MDTTEAMTNKELAAQMIGQLETLGADWIELLDSIHLDSGAGVATDWVKDSHETAVRQFAEQVLKPMEDLMREAARRLGEKP